MASAAQTDFFRVGDALTLFPVVHESADYAQQVRSVILGGRYDCLAVALPPSFEEHLLAGIDRLPEISAVIQREDSPESAVNYVPVDPCQGMIMGIRMALQESIPCRFIDMEVGTYEVYEGSFPDAYALKRIPAETFMAALLPSMAPPPTDSQRGVRIRHMAAQVQALTEAFENILCLCSALDWPWLREVIRSRTGEAEPERLPGTTRLCTVMAKTLFFMLGEMPCITYLHEKSRAELTSDANLSIDGVKELLIETRRRWEREHDLRHHHLTPHVLRRYLKYVRNLTLLERRLTPDLYTLAVAAKQIGGDSFAISLVETARDYPYQPDEGGRYDAVVFGMDHAELADGEVVALKNRLAGAPRIWRTLPLRPQPEVRKQQVWKHLWNPFGQCSWTPEDHKIESFNLHVREQAKALIGEGLARSVKFTTSVKDGIDIRETLRHWYEGEIYVKEIPPSRGSIEVVVLIFEQPARPAKYPWQQTWYAEHEQESTLCFYATPYLEKMIGPGIGEATYGGCFLLFPPRPIPNVWEDDRFAFARTLEERLLGSALFHSSEPHITVVSPGPPLLRWRQIARRFRKKIVHIPLNRFSLQTIQRLRRFHVLNGKHVRSYAAQFIRDF